MVWSRVEGAALGIIGTVSKLRWRELSVDRVDEGEGLKMGIIETESSKRIKIQALAENNRRRLSLSMLFFISMLVGVSIVVWKDEVWVGGFSSALSAKEHQLYRAIKKVDGLMVRMTKEQPDQETGEAMRNNFVEAKHDLQDIIRECSKEELVKAILYVSGPGAVVDVGASDGSLLTFPALASKRVVYAVEPDERNMRKILVQAEQTRAFSRRAKLVRDAVGPGQRFMYMQFHKEDESLSCVHCHPNDSSEVSYAQVEMLGLDRFVKHSVHLFKSHTLGFEGSVFQGAQEMFDSFGVHFAIVNFDPRRMSMHGNFEKDKNPAWVDFNRPDVVLDFLLERHYECFDLLSSEKSNRIGELTKANAVELLAELKESESSTDLFCIKPAL